MSEWIWVDSTIALSAHREQIAEHGGGDGIRDVSLFEGAMARPQNLVAYDDAAAMAASYAFGIARNHPFIDGNKRTAAVVSEAFLTLNGYVLNVNDGDLVIAFLALAAGDLTEDALADWFRERISAA